MTDPAPATAPRPDNLFGICHRIGEDFGFDPLWLRIALGAAFILAPLPVIGGYFAMGAIVLISRLVAPDRRRPAPSAQIVPLPTPVPAPVLAQAA